MPSGASRSAHTTVRVIVGEVLTQLSLEERARPRDPPRRCSTSAGVVSVTVSVVVVHRPLQYSPARETLPTRRITSMSMQNELNTITSTMKSCRRASRRWSRPRVRPCRPTSTPNWSRRSERSARCFVDSIASSVESPDATVTFAHDRFVATQPLADARTSTRSTRTSSTAPSHCSVARPSTRVAVGSSCTGGGRSTGCSTTRVCSSSTPWRPARRTPMVEMCGGGLDEDLLQNLLKHHESLDWWTRGSHGPGALPVPGRAHPPTDAGRAAGAHGRRARRARRCATTSRVATRTRGSNRTTPRSPITPNRVPGCVRTWTSARANRGSTPRDSSLGDRRATRGVVLDQGARTAPRPLR